MALVKCHNCQGIVDEDDIRWVTSSLGDDYMGTGSSMIDEAFCPYCGEDDLDWDFQEDEFESDEEEDEEEDDDEEEDEDE